MDRFREDAAAHPGRAERRETAAHKDNDCFEIASKTLHPGYVGRLFRQENGQSGYAADA
jgi:hypothetical protein